MSVQEEIADLKLRIEKIEGLILPKSPKIVEDEGDRNEEPRHKRNKNQ